MDSRRGSVRTTASQFYEPDTPYDEEDLDVFDDQYAESYAGSIREPRAAQSDAAFLSPFGDEAAVDYDHVDSRAPSPQMEQLQHRTSIMKSSGHAAHDASLGTSDVLYEPATNASRNSIAPSNDPFDDETGPSHPYEMYPQGLGVSRTVSMATTSSLRTSDHQGPAHPYAMYPQDISSDGTVSESMDSIPVGFSGMEQNRHRRVGAEGEEDDIIGIDGHVEQLPPYTRFDENGGKAIAGMLMPSPGDPFVSSAVAQSMSDPSALTRSQPQNTTQARPSSTGSSHRTWHDVTWNEWWALPWKDKRKIRACGISLGYIMIAVLAIIVVVVVCVSVIGGFMTRQRDHGKNFNQAQQPPSAIVVTTTELIDASPLASPTGSSMPYLPTGTYQISLFANGNKSACLGTSSQSSAWSCFPQGQVLINVVNNTISIAKLHNGSVSLGAQPPVLGPQKLQLVTDVISPILGDAYQFQTRYDKVVVVDEAQFSKRDASVEREFLSNGLYSRVVQPGQRPWFCYWNNTFIEGFIYVQQNTSNETTSYANSGSAIPTMTAASAVAKRGSYRLASSSSCSTGTWAKYNVVTANPSASTSTQAVPTTTGYPRLVRFQEARISNQQPAGYCQKMQLLYDGTFSPVADGSGNPITVYLNETDPVLLYKREDNSRQIVERGSLKLSDSCYCQLRTP